MPSKAHDRRDPQKGKKGFSKNKGFTLIELMIVVAVVAVIASLALPSYRAIIEKRQVTKAAEQLTAILSAVKSEAVRYNVPVAFSIDQDSQCVGIHQVLKEKSTSCSFTPDTDENSCQIDCGADTSDVDYEGIDRAWLYTQFSDEDVVQTGSVVFDDDGNHFLVFDPTRATLDAEYSTGISIPLVSKGEMYALNVEVDRLGRIKICNATGDYTSVPGYGPCPIRD